MSDESRLTVLSGVPGSTVLQAHHRLLARKGLVLDRAEVMVLLNEVNATTVHAFAVPSLIATVAVIRCIEETAQTPNARSGSASGVRAVDARNILLSRDAVSAWLLEQRPSGEPLLRVLHVEPDLLSFELRRLFDAMRAPYERVQA